MVCDAGGLLKHAYFPRGSVLSLLNGAAIETANIGREGAFGPFNSRFRSLSGSDIRTSWQEVSGRTPSLVLSVVHTTEQHPYIRAGRATGVTKDDLMSVSDSQLPSLNRGCRQYLLLE
jgi:hypothetical protein